MKKFHIHYDLYIIYKQNFYHDMQDEIDTIFGEYHVPLLEDFDHPVLIK